MKNRAGIILLAGIVALFVFPVAGVVLIIASAYTYFTQAKILDLRLQSGQPHALIIDVETTGLLPHDKPPTKAAVKRQPEAWPRIVQIAWIALSKDHRVVEKEVYYIHQSAPIPIRAMKVHGITDEMCEEYGIELQEALHRLFDIADECDVIVGHNIAFDEHIIMAECYKCDIEYPLHGVRKFDTMSLAKKYDRDKISLSELADKMIGARAIKKKDIRAHDALDDALLTASIYVYSGKAYTRK